MRCRPIQEGKTLPTIAMDLRMAGNGSYDCSEKEVKRLVQCIVEAINSWTPSRKTEARFDNCVLEMCVSALFEAERRKPWWWNNEISELVETLDWNKTWQDPI